jgi:seryl-tRNA synthetase
MDQFLLVGLGALVTAVASLAGYLLKRWWEGQSVRDDIQDFERLAKLQKDMKGDNTSLQALRELKKEISDRNARQAKDEAAVIENIEGTVRELSSDEFRIEDTLRSQQEMNRYAFHLASLAEKELEFLIEALEGLLDDEEVKRFHKTQRAWRLYSRRQADFSTGMFEGGSMRPLVYNSELRALTIERAAKIKNEIRDRHRSDPE